MDSQPEALWVKLNEININLDKILNIYVTGSRLHATSKENSDWDIVIIVCDDFIFPEKGTFFGQQCMLSVENYDLHFYPEAYVRSNLITHKDFYIIELPWIPSKFVLKQTIDLISITTLDKARFLKCVKGFGKYTRTKVHRLFPVNLYIAKKNIGHEIRNIAYAYQILLHDKIVDYSATSGIMFDILAQTSDKVDDYAHFFAVADQMIAGLTILAEKMLGIVSS
jgi:hypothetical protein